MLPLGQKVKVIENARCNFDNTLMPTRGQVARILYYSNESDTYPYKIDIDETYLYARYELYPIDDEPCDEEFLADYKELINEKEKVV